MAHPQTRQAIVQAIMKRKGETVLQKEKKTMKGYIPSYLEGDEKCVVCGDRATGYHYKCITCEGCKGFFRRTVQKGLQSSYQCKHTRQCEVNKTTRNQCQLCRYQKCVDVGMATDLVLDEEKRQAKRRLIEHNREVRRHKELSQMMAQCGWRLERMTPDEKRLVQTISQAQYDTAQEQQIAMKCLSEEFSPPEKFSSALTAAITTVVNFAKKIPLFVSQIAPEDLVGLLKGGCIEVITLQCATSYEAEFRTITIFPLVRVTREQLRHTRLEPFAESLFTLAEKLSTLELNSLDVAMMQAIMLLTEERPNLTNVHQIKRAQDILVKAFAHYLNETRPNQTHMCAQLLGKITEIRAISTCLASSLMSMRLDDPEDLEVLFTRDTQRAQQNNGIFQNTTDTTFNNMRGPHKTHTTSSVIQNPNLHRQIAVQYNPTSVATSKSAENAQPKAPTMPSNVGKFSWRNELINNMMEVTHKALSRTKSESPKTINESMQKSPNTVGNNGGSTAVKRPLSLPDKFSNDHKMWNRPGSSAMSLPDSFVPNYNPRAMQHPFAHAVPSIQIMTPNQYVPLHYVQPHPSYLLIPAPNSSVFSGQYVVPPPSQPHPQHMIGSTDLVREKSHLLCDTIPRSEITSVVSSKENFYKDNLPNIPSKGNPPNQASKVNLTEETSKVSVSESSSKDSFINKDSKSDILNENSKEFLIKKYSCEYKSGIPQGSVHESAADSNSVTMHDDCEEKKSKSGEIFSLKESDKFGKETINPEKLKAFNEMEVE